jgi:hypothetical protein
LAVLASAVLASAVLASAVLAVLVPAVFEVVALAMLMGRGTSGIHHRLTSGTPCGRKRRAAEQRIVSMHTDTVVAQQAQAVVGVAVVP